MNPIEFTIKHEESNSFYLLNTFSQNLMELISEIWQNKTQIGLNTHNKFFFDSYE